jgi:predicted RNA-binding Zn-ribbon protein involved in translation (DUF1610 family)
MTPEYRIAIEKQIKEYFKSFHHIGRIVNIKCEHTFNDLGVEINVWNVKTKNGDWWVVEGEGAPMNLYTQGAFYFSADEAYSFHMGIIQRLSTKDDERPIIDEMPLDIEHLKSINRKLNLASQKLAFDLEPEEFQSIGLICRESLIELSKELCKRNPELIKNKGLKKSDFKGVAHEIIDLYIPGSEESDLRNYARKLVDIAWDYDSVIVHSQNKNYPDVKIALLFTSAVITLLENLFYKYFGFYNVFICPKCGSKQIEIISDNENKMIAKCASCGEEQTIQIQN